MEIVPPPAIPKVVIPKLNFEDYSVLANTDIPPIPLEPIDPPCLFRVSASFSTSGVLSVVIWKEDTSYVLKLFEGVNLLVDCLYMADIAVNPGDRVTFRYSVDTTIKVIRVQEIK